MIDPKNPDYHNTPISDQRPGYGYKPADHSAWPAVSIITPFYNTGQVFAETARSVLQQSLQQWEWIIVNDGSDDPESLQLLDPFRSLDPRIHVVDHLTNRGLPAARNTGCREARSNYLLYLDSDDLLEPTAAEKWLWFLESNPKYAFAGGYSAGFGAHEYLWQSGFQDMEANMEANRINHVVMVRKDVLQKVGGYDETMRSGLEDWDFWVRSASQGFWGASIPEYLHWYRTRPSHTDRWEGLNQKQFQDQREQFRLRYPHLWEGAFPQFPPYVCLEVDRLNEELPCQNRLLKTKPRLLLIAPWLVTGGAEKFNLDLMQQLSQRGWELTVVTTVPSDNPWQHEFEKITPDVFPLANFIEWSDYPRFLSYLIQSRQIDAVILIASEEGYRLLPYLRIRYPQLPILDYLHFITPDWLNGGFPRLSALFHSSLDLTVVTSQQLRGWMVSSGVDEERVRVSTANVDTNLWRPDEAQRKSIRSQLGIADDTIVILYVGRIEKQKQPQVFANTMRRLNEEDLPFLALVVGDGSLNRWLFEFVEYEKLQERVRILGTQPLSRVRDLLAAGDIIFLPSENEGISLTLFEGMASGLVPVGADVGGQRELVSPDCGFLLPRGTEEEEADRYARVLMRLIRDPLLRIEMGRASRERVANHFTLDQMGERMEELIRVARRFREESSQKPSTEEMAGLLARQGVEYFRASAEIKRLAKSAGSMPPAPARTYFYFAFRQALYPLIGRFSDKDWLARLKDRVKAVLVRPQS